MNEIITILNGKEIKYGSNTMFFVQIGRNKSSYRNKYCFEGNLVRAVLWYNGINVGNGYKKRLLMAPNVVLLRNFS